MFTFRFSRARGIASVAAVTTVFAIAGAGSSAYAATSLATSPASVSVGSGPTGLAYSPDGDVLYVANMGGSSVSEVDTATGTVTHTDSVSAGTPAMLAVSPDGAYVYVASWADGKLSVIDTATHTEVSSVGGLSMAMDVDVSPDGNKVYVVEYGNAQVSVFSANNGTPTLQSTISVGYLPSSIAVSPDGSRLYVANSGAGTVSVIDTAINTAIPADELAATASPWAIAISADGHRLAVSDQTGQGVKIFDLVADTSSTVSLAERSFSVWFGGTGAHLYATEFDSSRVNTIDVSSLQVTSEVPSGASGMRDVVMSPDGCQLSAAGQNTGTVYFLNVSPCEPLTRSGDGGNTDGNTDGSSENLPESTGVLSNTGLDRGASIAWMIVAFATLITGAGVLVVRRALRK